VTALLEDDISRAILEMRDLLRLLAEPAIAERDQKHREELRRIVGGSEAKAKAVMMMDGSHAQIAIHRETKFHKGSLSVLVKQLSEAGLLTGDIRQPKLALDLSSGFFDKENL